MCPQGTYTAAAAATSCDLCPDTSPISPAGSDSKASCQTLLVSVRLTLTLPMALSGFSKTKERDFKQVIADVANVHVSLVKIVSIQDQESAARRLLQGGITLGIEIGATDNAAADAIVAKMTDDKINAQMNKVRDVPE